jgi:mono/diheme cytochrome c family protein
MNLRPFIFAVMVLFMAAALALVSTGCNDAPGKPKVASEVANPDQVLDFATLYGQNCAACHGDHGKNGAALSLANPVYLSIASAADIHNVISIGVSGTMMPGFGKSTGGMLTDRQISILAQGMLSSWSNAAELEGQTPPPYTSIAQGDAGRGNSAYMTYCSSCHGAEGAGTSASKHAAQRNAGSLVDPAYLALITDQGLRSIIIAGQPGQGMPDWRGHSNGSQAHALSDQEVTDIVAWLATHRVASPGQPYQQSQ